jgi:hypothetical protein
MTLAVSACGAAPAMAQSSGEPAQGELSPIDVVGRSASGAYHAEEAAGAKTDLPLRELPQSVRILTRQAIDDLGATRLDDVLDHVGGVSRQNSFGGLWDNIAIRGLPGNENTGMATLLNGFASNRGFNAPRDLAGVDRGCALRQQRTRRHAQHRVQAPLVDGREFGRGLCRQPGPPAWRLRQHRPDRAELRLPAQRGGGRPQQLP